MKTENNDETSQDRELAIDVNMKRVRYTRRKLREMKRDNEEKEKMRERKAERKRDMGR